MDIVYEYPSTGRSRRLLGVLVSLFGALLVFAGLVAAILPLFYVLAVAYAALGGGGDGVPAPDATLAIATAFAVAAIAGGLRLVRGKRRLVLFLRRFGFVGATQAVTFAAVGALGRRWRLVTLDDAEVAPMGTPRRMRWLSVAIGLVGAAVVAWGAYWLFGGGFESVVGESAKNMMKGATLRDFLPRLFLGFIVVPILAALVLGVILLPVIFSGAVAGFAWSSYGAIGRAERAKTVRIDSEAQIEPVALAVLRRSRGIVGPRLAVARVASSIWQPVVRRLASAAAVVLIDVSEPTRNLLWEIERLRPEMRGRWVLVGEKERMRRIAEGAQPESPHRARLLQLLDGEEVLAYSTEPRDLKRFARSLQARLETIETLRSL